MTTQRSSPVAVQRAIEELIATWRETSQQLNRDASYLDGCNGRPHDPQKQRALRVEANRAAKDADELEAILTRVAQITLSASPTERERAAIELLKRLYDWDVMGIPDSDGAYWRKEILNVVAPTVPVTDEDIAWGQRVLDAREPEK